MQKSHLPWWQESEQQLSHLLPWHQDPLNAPSSMSLHPSPSQSRGKPSFAREHPRSQVLTPLSPPDCPKMLLALAGFFNTKIFSEMPMRESGGLQHWTRAKLPVVVEALWTPGSNQPSPVHYYSGVPFYPVVTNGLFRTWIKKPK